jgi:hypothetical protein
VEVDVADVLEGSDWAARKVDDFVDTDRADSGMKPCACFDNIVHNIKSAEKVFMLIAC